MINRLEHLFPEDPKKKKGAEEPPVYNMPYRDIDRVARRLMHTYDTSISETTKSLEHLKGKKVRAETERDLNYLLSWRNFIAAFISLSGKVETLTKDS
jgi:hypothetical protein